MGNCDFQEMKNKTADECLEAFKTMVKRKYVKLPQFSFQTDNGAEFKSVFHEFLKKKNILHKTTVPNRHKQMSMIESLNRILGALFNGYMNTKEQESGQTYKEWTDILPILRTELNKIRTKKEENPRLQKIPDIDTTKQPAFKIGDVVYYKSEVPIDALGNPQPTKHFRTGDRRWSVDTRKIINIFVDSDVGYRYYLQGLPNVSYVDSELKLAKNEKESKYIIERFLKSKIENKQKLYLVKWKGYLVKDATWQSESKLIEDIGKKHLQELVKNMKK